MVAKKLIKSKFKNQVDRNGVVVELEIRKYQREVFYQNLWNQYPDLVKSRGAVFIGGKQVVFPMDKCFNYSENDAGLNLPKDTKVVAYKKLNGFMLNLTHITDVGWIVSTTGDATLVGNESTNDFINMGVDYIRKHDGFRKYMDLFHEQEEVEGVSDNTLTLTFEVCHPDDPHIVVEEFGLHPICFQLNGVTVPLDVEGEPIATTIQGILDEVKNVKHEGFMVYDLDGNLIFKLKSPFYLTKKWVQRGGSKKVWSGAYKERLDEEYYPIVKYLRANYSRVVWDMLSENDKSEAFLHAYKYTTEEVKNGT